MLAQQLTRIINISLCIILVFTLFSVLIPHKVSAGLVEDNSGCADLLLVFGRGSGQNPGSEELKQPLSKAFSELEPESYSFFNWHREYLLSRYPSITYKAVSVHDYPGKYDQVGYKAVGVFPQFSNLANAEASWIPGDYNQSVDHGVAETVGYLKDQIANCPNQTIIAGGYSQGAQVMGNALFQLTAQEREKIAGVGLLADPKYIGSSGDNRLNPFDTASSYAWRRGTATNNDRGMLDARVPYTPSDMDEKLISWCSKTDPICAGWSGANKDYRAAHSSYSGEPMRNTVNELMQLAASKLAAAERARGGLSSEAGAGTLTQADRDRKRDIMFVFNDDSNEYVLGTFRYSLDPMLYHFTREFNETRFAAKSFGENDYGFSTPRVDNIQSFLPYMGYNPSYPSTSASNLTLSFAKKYPFGQFVYGSGDIPDPYQLGLERAIVSSGWSSEPDVEKNIILLVDRPPKDPYEYNICNGIVRQWLHYPDTDGYKNCFVDFKPEFWQKVLLPESCENAFLVITSEICAKPQKTASLYQINKRSLEDTVKIAQAYKVKLSIVIPNKVTDPFNALGTEEMRNKLKGIAYATGGSFLYYDKKTQYDVTSLQDTLYQVFTKPAPSMILQLGGNQPTGKTLATTTNTPAILDVSQGGVTADNYAWDFNDDGQWDQITPGPVAEHQYTENLQTFVKVQARQGSTVISETSLPITVEQTTTVPAALPIVPDTVARQNQNGNITLSWTPNGEGELIAFDPTTGHPVVAAPLSAGTATILAPAPYTSLVVRVVGDQSTSDPATIQVSPALTLPLPVVTPPEPDEQAIPEEPASPYEDPTLCYKLQQCNQESNSSSVATIQGSNNEPTITPRSVAQAPQINQIDTDDAPTSPITTAQVAGINTQEITPIQEAIPASQVKGDRITTVLFIGLFIATIFIVVIVARRLFSR